jgi:glycosyltransferase involved in cell wall biosynthesis
MKVVVLTTSYPRFPGDNAGVFIEQAVERVCRAGVQVEVVAPTRSYGVAYGAGVVENVRRRPWRAAALPVLAGEMARAARRASKDADLVHAHWLPTGLIALATRRPFVLHLHGTDVELARRAPAAARAILRRARVVVAVSNALAESAGALGARDVRVIPNGVHVPDEITEEATPPEVLFAGRLSPEKGILELMAAANGHPLVVAGDGPLRQRVPQALGFVARSELERLYGRAAVVACPSRRE